MFLSISEPNFVVPSFTNLSFCCFTKLVTKLVVAALISVVTFGFEKVPFKIAFTGILSSFFASTGVNFAINAFTSFPKYLAGTSNFKSYFMF